MSFDMDVEMSKCTRNKRKVDEGYSPSTSINTNKRNSKNKSTPNDNHNKESTDDSDGLSDNLKQRYKKKSKINGQSTEAQASLLPSNFNYCHRGNKTLHYFVTCINTPVYNMHT